MDGRFRDVRPIALTPLHIAVSVTGTFYGQEPNVQENTSPVKFVYS